MHPASKAALLEGMRVIATERDPDALLRAAAKVAADVLGAALAWVVARNEQRPLVSAAFGFEPGPLEATLFDSFLFRLDDTVVTRGETPSELIGLAGRAPFENLALARFELGSFRGFLMVMNRAEAAFNADDAQLLQSLAAQVGGFWRAASELLIARATHSIHRTLVEQLPAVTYHRAVDKPGIPSFVSPQVVELLGFSHEEVMGEPDFFKGRVHPDDRSRISANQAAFRREGSALPVRIEYRLLHRDGSVRWVHNHALTVRDRVDDAQLVVGVIIDVTEQKLAEQARREAEQRMEEQLRQTQKLDAVGRLAGGIAHDFNNLLGVILGYTQMVQQRGAADDATRADLAQITEAAERAKHLTAQMLSFTGRQMVEPRVVDVADLVHNMEDLLSSLLGADITLNVRVEDGQHLALIDPSELQQLLLNLVTNARDASARGGQVDVSVGRGDGEAIGKQGAFISVRISDKGCGMDAATRARIFEPFFTTKERGKGTGLGLSMALGVAKEAGGGISVESVEGMGSVFCLLLPRASPRRVSSQRVQAMRAPDTVAPSSSETILVVEDEPALRRLVCRLLRARGYKVLEAANGDEALRVAAEQPSFDLLLTDVVMPGRTGRELFDELTRRGQERPVLFMSGYTDDTIVRHGVRENEFALLPKPFSAAALYEKVRFVLDGANAGLDSEVPLS